MTTMDQRKLGAEFQVNIYITNYQGFPATSMDPNGNFVVVWQSGGQDGSGYGIYGQHHYGSDGNSIGNEFQVNNYTNSNQRYFYSQHLLFWDRQGINDLASSCSCFWSPIVDGACRKAIQLICAPFADDWSPGYDGYASGKEKVQRKVAGVGRPGIPNLGLEHTW